MTVSWDRNGTYQRHRDGFDRLREAADSAFCVLACFGGTMAGLLWLGSVMT